MELNAYARLSRFLDFEIKAELEACIDGSFEINDDPYIGFKLLRECVTNLKARHVKLYAEYLKEKSEIDEEIVDDSEEGYQEYLRLRPSLFFDNND